MKCCIWFKAVWSVNTSTRKLQCKKLGPAFVLGPWLTCVLSLKMMSCPVTAYPGCSGSSGEGGGQVSSTSCPGNSQRGGKPPLPHRGCACGCSEGNTGASSYLQGQGKVACATDVMAFLDFIVFLLCFCSGAGISPSPQALKVSQRLANLAVFHNTVIFQSIFFNTLKMSLFESLKTCKEIAVIIISNTGYLVSTCQNIADI